MNEGGDEDAQALAEITLSQSVGGGGVFGLDYPLNHDPVLGIGQTAAVRSFVKNFYPTLNGDLWALLKTLANSLCSSSRSLLNWFIKSATVMLLSSMIEARLAGSSCSLR